VTFDLSCDPIPGTPCPECTYPMRVLTWPITDADQRARFGCDTWWQYSCPKCGAEFVSEKYLIEGSEA
jgi:hypothetical protein